MYVRKSIFRTAFTETVRNVENMKFKKSPQPVLTNFQRSN